METQIIIIDLDLKKEKHLFCIDLFLVEILIFGITLLLYNYWNVTRRVNQPP